MKLFKCKKMGDVTSTKCYNCYSNGLNNDTFSSRVLCKRTNVLEEMVLKEGNEQFGFLVDQSD